MFALGPRTKYFSMSPVLLKQEYTVPSQRVHSLMTRGHCCPWQGHTGPIQESVGPDRLPVITFISVCCWAERAEVLWSCPIWNRDTIQGLHQRKWSTFGTYEQHYNYMVYFCQGKGTQASRFLSDSFPTGKISVYNQYRSTTLWIWDLLLPACGSGLPTTAFTGREQ
jgi:hypothetical protein